ncbi:MAG: MOSC domain-containing protein, partial [Candidatus Sericytochromatia bacterium]|nr:MOSC domain-containing protein [Candidatus Sericytochromatia bacterium]
MLTIKELLNSIPQIGLLEWIGLRTEKHQEVISVNDANLVEGIGIDGDHRTKRPESKTGGKRQVTLLQFEYLPVIASIMKEE